MDSTVSALTALSAVDGQLTERKAMRNELALVLDKRRAALRQTIPDVFLAAYDALSQAGRRPAVVPVRKAHCGGCCLRLPPQLDSSIRRRQSLYPCPHCRRLLYTSSPAEVSETADAPGRRLEGRPERKAPALKPGRRIAARRSIPRDPLATEKREPRGKNARRVRAARHSL